MLSSLVGRVCSTTSAVALMPCGGVAPLVARLPHDRVAGQLARLSEVLELDQEIVSREAAETLGRSVRRALPGALSDSSAGPDPLNLSI
jgi:hypothetical protein